MHHVKSTSKTNARKQLDNSVPSTSGLLLADHKKLLRETSASLFPESLLYFRGVEAGQPPDLTAQASLLLACFSPGRMAKEAYVLRTDHRTPACGISRICWDG